MKKRLIAIIIAVAMAASTLTGCSFFSHATAKDMKQVVATVDSYTISSHYTKTNDDGTTESVPYTYVTEAKSIYKQDLIEYLNNNSSTLSQQYSTAQEMVEYSVQMLGYTHLVINEVDALINAGGIPWDSVYDEETGAHYYTQSNIVKENLYSVIDNSLKSFEDAILEERDEPVIEVGEGSDSSETTYPVPDTDTEDVEDLTEWQPELARYPGLKGTEDERSLGKETMRRFIALLKDRAYDEDEFRITAEDKEKFDEDFKNIQNVIDTKGIEYVYPMLHTTHIMYYLSGETLERNEKISLMQTYLNNSVSVSDAEVRARYDTLLQTQKENFSVDRSAFNTAGMGTDTILYYPNQNVFYVKHILIQFSSAQTDALTAYKAKPGVSEDDIERYRERLVDQIVCYKHKDGEDDTSREYTITQVFNDIKAQMTPLAGNIYEAERKFDELIYLYNQDEGAFGDNDGYAVLYDLEGATETYMEEFADAARKMYETLQPGQVYPELVITDYGVHFMYLAQVPTIGERKLDDYTTPGRIETYRDVLSATMLTDLQNSAFYTWQAEKIVYYERTETLKYYESRYKDLY